MMDKLKLRLAGLMRGRYGMDALYKATMAMTFVFLILNLLFPSVVFYFLSIACAVVSFARAFSKQHAKRSSENQKYLAMKTKYTQRLLQLKNRLKDVKTHRYRACPSCKKTLRIKKKVGVNHITCPVCKNQFDVNIRF